MLLRLLLLIMFPAMIWAQTPALREVVMRKFDNGKPHVVLYFDAKDELVKEHVYFANGNTAWIGHYKNDLEDGSWEFYWENGKLKSREYYSKGKEDGVCQYFDENGKKIKEVVWKNGKLIEETKF
ncbi:MAG TPA: hypothetical protein VIK71_03465 [Flavobacteriales bacterium]